MMSSNLFLAVLLQTLLLITYGNASGEQSDVQDPNANNVDADEFRNLQLIQGYLSKLHHEQAGKAQRKPAAAAAAALQRRVEHARQNQFRIASPERRARFHLGAKNVRNDRPEKRMYDYSLDYDSFVAPEKRTPLRH